MLGQFILMKWGIIVDKIVVTGATSMIGTALIKACLSRGVQVVALVRKGTRRLDRLPESDLVSVVYCGFDEMRDFVPETSDADVFYHFAWAGTSKSGGRYDPEAQEPNIRYTLDAVRLARRFGCHRFVGASSQAEYGLSDAPLTKDTPIRPYMAYGVAKYAGGRLAEMLCESLGMEFVWGRILSVYGPHDNENTLLRYIIESLLDGESPELTPGGQIWDYLYEDDAGEAFFALGASAKAQGAYCVGSGDGRPLRSFVEEIEQVAQSMVPVQYGARPYGENQVMYLKADISPLTRDTGWTPKVSFAEGIRNMITAMNVYSGGIYSPLIYGILAPTGWQGYIGQADEYEACG